MHPKVTKLRANIEFETKNCTTQNELSIFKAQTKYTIQVNNIPIIKSTLNSAILCQFGF